MPKAFPKEFREDVIRVFRTSDASTAQVAKDFGISASCLKRWLSIDERSTARTAGGGGGPVAESDALREANKRIQMRRKTRCCAGPRTTRRRRTCRASSSRNR